MAFSDQETFDLAVCGVINQGGPSVEKARCRYRSTNGRRCVVGHCIPDERYRPDLEGLSATHDEVRSILTSLGYNEWLLDDLQSAHDETHSLTGVAWLDAFVGEVQEVAEEYGLNTAAMTEAAASLRAKWAAEGQS